MSAHQNNFKTTVAAPGTSVGATATPLTDVPTVSAPFYLTFDPDDTNGHYEVIPCLTKGVSDVTHAATTLDHTTGEAVIMSVVAEELDALSTDLDTATTNSTAAATPGTIISRGKAEAVTGWLFCDGSAVSRTTYSALFAIVGETYGAGNGTTTFNVPNLQGKVIFGKSAVDTAFDALGESGGAKTINIAHTHTMTAHTHAFGSGSTTGGDSFNDDGNMAQGLSAAGGHTHTPNAATIGNGSNDATGSSGSATQSVMSEFLTVYYLIKT